MKRLSWNGKLAIALVIVTILAIGIFLAWSPRPREEPTNNTSYSQPQDSDNRADERLKMVETQLETRNIRDQDVLQAMKSVPRHEFVPDGRKPQAYRDSPLPIGYGQTISQPYIVAFMTQALELRPNQCKVLEIGTGSGYQAAVLAEICEQVYSIEIVPELAERASKTLDRLGYDNVEVRNGDGYFGWEEYAPFDAIIVTCAGSHIPAPLFQQLKDGGRLIMPVGPSHGIQTLDLVTRKDGQRTVHHLIDVRFVPMTGHIKES